MGRVKSLPRIVNNRYGTRTLKQRILKPSDNKGYKTVVLHNKDKGKTKNSSFIGCFMFF